VSTSRAALLLPGWRWSTADVDARGGGVPGVLLAAWGALLLNAMSFYGTSTIVPIPGPIGQLVAQGSLALALLLALIANPRAVMRPSLFLVLMMMLGVVGLMVSIHNQFAIGSTFRALRLIGFIVVVWLLTPWWGRRDMLLLRCHLICLWVVLGTVIVGAVVAPGLAFSFEGRLAGVLWPIPATQVAHYAAIVFGISAVLWMCRVMSGRRALIALLVSVAILVGTHTRTATIATIAALVFAAASLFLGHARVRRTSAMGALVVVLLATLFASQLTTWAMRGQSTEEAAQLTGRTKVWSEAVNTPRPQLNELFGSGLSDQSFNGLPIDNNWVATLLDQGWFGVVVKGSIILLLLLMAATRERGPHRAAALFLIVYCAVASITETGLGSASPYQLDLVVAAALLVPEARRRQM
jgi:O-antigen ligase